MYKALYNFSGQDGEMNLVKGEEVEVKEKDDNGELALPIMAGADVRLVDGRQERSGRMGTLELVSLFDLVSSARQLTTA